MFWDILFFSLPFFLLVGIIIFRRFSSVNTEMGRKEVDGSYWGGYTGTVRQARAPRLVLPDTRGDRVHPPGPYQPLIPRPEAPAQLSDLTVLHP